ncbi:hypothetical protein [Planctopirus hydrillae]|uniref:Uncharacterized protein n=1 Tax=Planctopirus hydrillae TaxID=1841610 RepID=A0A1C3E487_9PLAN|nr:hypothetical protein [Planctopirus hydrillae]ODA28056.1 hypothetical protein A6X21_14440 [Planctopirus hydrillae]
MQLRDPETLKLIQETAKQAAGSKDKVSIITLPGEPEGVYGVVTPDGQLQRMVAAPRPRQHSILTVDQVPLLVNHFREIEGLSAPSIWYSAAQVIVLATDSKLEQDLRPRGVLKLKPTPQWELMKKLEESPQWLDQKQMVSLLRIKLSDSIEVRSKGIVQTLRRMKFNMTVNQRGNIEHGRESIGSDIVSDVYGSEDAILPESVWLEIQVFDDPSLKSREVIQCALEVDAQKGLLALIPTAGELTKAMDNQMSKLRDLFDQTCNAAPLFHGQP